VKCLISYIVILVKLYTSDYHWFVDNLQDITLVILSNTDMLTSGTRQFSCRKQFPFVLFRYQCLGPTYSEKCCFCLHHYRLILYSRTNWYALVKSCINVNHYVLLVRRHLKYVWFTKFTKFWGEVKNGPSLRISKNKKSFQLQGASPLTPDQGLCPWTPLGLRPQTLSVPSSKRATTLLIFITRETIRKHISL